MEEAKVRLFSFSFCHFCFPAFLFSEATADASLLFFDKFITPPQGKHQLTAELREKEMTSLKEELKSLQLCKYSLEKKLSELEQKLELQSQSKDGHLKQLGEVEQRFGVVSRQCAILKQAHDRLQQNGTTRQPHTPLKGVLPSLCVHFFIAVEEAVKINKKLTALNKSQASKINTLTQDAERLNGELIKAKVLSAYQSGEDSSGLKESERQIQQLQQRLRMETELNKKLQTENDGAHLEKQEVINSLQHTQQLLHTQTQALSRSQAELLAQREEYQDLKRQHELVLEEAKGKEERFGRLKEECKNDNILWEKEKRVLQEQLQAQQEELGSVREAYEHLHDKHKQLTCARLQTENIHSLKYEGMHSKDGTGVQTDGQPSISVSFEEQIDSQSATQSGAQGNDTTHSEPVPGQLESTVTDKRIHPTEVQHMALVDPPSRQTSDTHAGTQPPHVDLPPSQHPGEEEVTRQSCPSDKSGLGPTGSPAFIALSGSERDVRDARDAPSNAAMSTLTDLNKNQASGIHETSQASTSFNVDELSSADKGSSSNSMVCRREGLSVLETSSVYDGESDPGAEGKGEVGVQQTLCIPEARQAPSPDKAPDSPAVSLTAAQGPVCAQPQFQTPAAQASPPSAPIIQKAGEGETDDSTQEAGQAGQCGSDRPTEVTTVTQQNDTTDVLPGPDTPISQLQHPAESASTQRPGQSQCDLFSAGLQSSNRLSICAVETQVLHSQSVECSPVPAERTGAAKVACAQRSIPAAAADTNCSFVPAHLRSPELYPPTSPDTEADPPQVAGPSEQPCTSDCKKDQSNIPADASVASQTSKTSSETGADERSPCRAADPIGSSGTKTHRPSFVWGARAKSPPLMSSHGGAERARCVTQGSPVCTMSQPAPGPAVSEHRSATPRRFLETSSAFPTPIFQQDRLNKRDSTAYARSAGASEGAGSDPGHKAEKSKDWNAIRRSISEMSTGMESRVSIAFSSAASGALTSLSEGNGLRQDCTPSQSRTHPRHHSSGGTTGQAAAEGCTQSSQGRLEQRPVVNIRAEIAKLEQFLSSEGVSLPKKSKVEE
ncbi:hypothetical protein ACEWY4_011317 [Coilia grayii]|uniref:Coiled-coil domain-containing protein 73 n=1 Tax=Coilia grayii TaxID=363190 RepID=A0ABD1K4F0_9TELE